MILSYLSLCFLAVLFSACIYYHIKTAPRPLAMKPFDLNRSLSLRGILALLIMFHHIGLTYSTSPMSIFQSWGTTLVAIFFLISGYGLMISYKKKGTIYLENFLSHRFGHLLPIFLLLTLVCIVILTMCHHTPLASIGERLLQNGITPLPNSWFMYVICVLYLIFYGVCKRYPSNRKLLLYSAAWSLVFIVALCAIGYGYWWYISIPSFTIGMFFALYESRTQRVLLSKPAMTLGALLGVLGVNFILCNITARSRYFFLLMGLNVLPVILLLTLYTFGMFSNKVTRYLGKISLEFYLVHGIFLSWVLQYLHLSWISFTLLALLFTIPSADLLHRLNQKIIAWMS